MTIKEYWNLIDIDQSIDLCNSKTHGINLKAIVIKTLVDPSTFNLLGKSNYDSKLSEIENKFKNYGNNGNLSKNLIQKLIY